MKKSRAVLARAICFSLCLSLTVPTPVFAGTWNQSVSGWSYRSDDGGVVKDTWLYESGNWYLFDAAGLMLTGWQKGPDGRWYFLNPKGGAQDKPEGAMLTGWRWIEGKCYFLTIEKDAGHPEGAMYCNERTPDGYQVSGSGAWMENGEEVFVLGKGIGRELTRVQTGTFARSGGGGGGSGGGGSHGGTSVSPDKKTDTLNEQDEEREEAAVPDKKEEAAPERKEEYTPPKEPEIIITEPDKEPEEGKPVTPSDATPATPSEATRMEEEDEDFLPDTDLEDPEGSIPAYEVHWTVYFTDKETHARRLFKTREGVIENGGTLSIGYVTTFIDADGNTWEAVHEPEDITVYGPGDCVIYVEFEMTETRAEEKDPYEEEKKELYAWITLAREAESLLTGEYPEEIPDYRFIADILGEADTRMETAAGFITDTETKVIYEIGKNIHPNGIILKELYEDYVTYSNTEVSAITIGEDTYYVSMFYVSRTFDESSCVHDYRTKVLKEAGCLDKGLILYVCSLCNKEINVKTAALGHIDENGDSVCDRCDERAFKQDVGSVISAVLNGTEMRFICVDSDYQGGMLYVALDEIPSDDIGGFLAGSYAESGIFNYFSEDFANEFSINGENLLTVTEEGTTAYAFLLSELQALTYNDTYEGSCVTRTMNAGKLICVNEDGTEDLIDREGSFNVRPAIVLAKTDEGEAVPTHWEVGDKVSREIHGETYTFTCIDQNYSDKLENHQKQALFFMDSIIPADFDSEYVYEDLGDGTYGYVFHPGPVSYFGETNDYKYSKVRKWLDDVTVFSAQDIQIGVSNSFTGVTRAGKFSELNENDLTSYAIGYQKMNARLYILSVDEALKYKDYLWVFGDGKEENPEDEMDTAKHSYWLRSPYGTGRDFDDTGMVYVVDLEKGCIRPQSVKPEGGSGDDYVDATTDVGIRPAFILPQS